MTGVAAAVLGDMYTAFLEQTTRVMAFGISW